MGRGVVSAAERGGRRCSFSMRSAHRQRDLRGREAAWRVGYLPASKPSTLAIRVGLREVPLVKTAPSAALLGLARWVATLRLKRMVTHWAAFLCEHLTAARARLLATAFGHCWPASVCGRIVGCRGSSPARVQYRCDALAGIASALHDVGAVNAV